MKKFLMLSVCFVAGVAVAQGLFPGLAVYSGDQQDQKVVVEEEADLPSIGDNSVVEETTVVEQDEEMPDLFKSTNESAPDVQPTETEDAPEDEGEEGEEEHQITIFPDDVESTIVPNDNFSFCTGKLKFVNTLPHTVKRIAVSLNYNGLVVDFYVRNIASKKGEKVEDLMLLGKACEHILDTPEIKINACDVEGMETEACKKKVVFIPLR